MNLVIQESNSLDKQHFPNTYSVPNSERIEAQLLPFSPLTTSLR